MPCLTPYDVIKDKSFCRDETSVDENGAENTSQLLDFDDAEGEEGTLCWTFGSCVRARACIRA